MRQKSLFLAGPSDPLGVPLHAIADSLPSHRFLVQQQGNSLVAHHDGCVTTVRVASPGPRPIDAPNIRSVVHVVTQLPEVIAGEALTPSHATASMLNSLASLGSVHVADGKLVLSSRFACLHCDPDEALRVNGALLLARMLHAPRSVLRGFEYRLRNRAPLMRFSNWIEEDFEELAEALEGLATCTVTRDGLTAQLPLYLDEHTDPDASNACALLHMSTEHAHPFHGLGLYCVLLMPHRATDGRCVDELCHTLNLRELDAVLEAPHFGAWIPNETRDGVVYVSFLPNPMCKIPGVTSLFGYWNAHRSLWASDVLAEEGLRA